MKSINKEFLKIIEKNADHIRKMQSTALKAEIKRNKRAQWMLFIITLVALGIIALSIMYDNTPNRVMPTLALVFWAVKER